MADTLEQAEARFRVAQEALECFTQEHMHFTLDGLEFVDQRNAQQLNRQLAKLRAAAEFAGAEWADELAKAPAEVRQ